MVTQPVDELCSRKLTRLYELSGLFQVRKCLDDKLILRLVYLARERLLYVIMWEE